MTNSAPQPSFQHTTGQPLEDGARAQGRGGPGGRGRRGVLWAAGLAVGLAGGSALILGGSGPGDEGTSDEKAPATRNAGKAGDTGGRVDLAAAQVMTFDMTTTVSGELRAANQVEIRNPLDSETTITEIVAEGINVKKGDVLVRLNAEQIQTRLDEQKLQMESARAALVEAEQSYQIQVSENDSAKRAADLKLALARLDFQQWLEGELASKQQDLDHNLERAEKDEDRLRDKFEKSQALFEKGYYSRDQLQQDELAWEQSVNTLAKARLDKDVFWEFEYPKQRKTKESAVSEAEAELERVERQNASRIASKEAALKNSRSSMQIREQQLNKLQEQVDGAVLKAPNDGLVVYSTSMDSMRWGNDQGPLQVGSRVYPNQSLIALPDTSAMVAAVKVHESLAATVRPGQRATVRVDAAGGERFGGVVESIGILAEQTGRWMDPNLREYTVRITLDLPKSEDGKAHSLKPSMRCEGEILLGTVNDALAVPVQAVMSEGPMRFVYVTEGGRYARRPIQIGRRSERFAEVVAGMSAGEQVLLRKPDAGEVINRPITDEELKVAGLLRNEQGQIVSARGGRGPGGPGGGRPGMAGAAGGGRGQPAVVGGAPAAATASGAVTATAAAPASTTKPASDAAPVKTDKDAGSTDTTGDAKKGTDDTTSTPTPAASK